MFLEYILPNVLLFGGLYALGKGLERWMWFMIENYDQLDKIISQNMPKR